MSDNTVVDDSNVFEPIGFIGYHNEKTTQMENSEKSIAKLYILEKKTNTKDAIIDQDAMLSNNDKVLVDDKNEILHEKTYIKTITIYRLPGELLGIGLHIIPPCNGEKLMRVFVKTITADGPASRPQGDSPLLKEGDEILEINDIKVGTIARNDCVELFRTAPVCITLKVLRKEEIQNCNIELHKQISKENGEICQTSETSESEVVSELNYNITNNELHEQPCEYSVKYSNSKNQATALKSNSKLIEHFCDQSTTVKNNKNVDHKEDLTIKKGDRTIDKSTKKDFKAISKENILNKFSNRNLITRIDGSFIILEPNNDDDDELELITRTSIFAENIKKRTQTEECLPENSFEKLKAKENNDSSQKNSEKDDRLHKTIVQIGSVVSHVPSTGNFCKENDFSHQVPIIENVIVTNGEHKATLNTSFRNDKEIIKENIQTNSSSSINETLEITFQNTNVFSEKKFLSSGDPVSPEAINNYDKAENIQVLDNQSISAHNVSLLRNNENSTSDNSQICDNKIINKLRIDNKIPQTFYPSKAGELTLSHYEFLEKPVVPALPVSLQRFSPDINLKAENLHPSEKERKLTNQKKGVNIISKFSELKFQTQIKESSIIHSGIKRPTQEQEVLTKELHMPGLDVTQPIKCSNNQAIKNYNHIAEQTNQNKSLYSRANINSLLGKQDCNNRIEYPPQKHFNDAWNSNRVSIVNEKWLKEKKISLAGLYSSSMDNKMGYKCASLPTSRRNSFGEQQGLKSSVVKTLTEQKQNIFDSLPRSRMDEGPFLVEVLNTFLDLGLKTEITLIEGRYQTVISEIKSSSPLARSGNIQIGDVLLAINGRDIVGLEKLQILQILRTVPRGIVRLIVCTPIAAEKYFGNLSKTYSVVNNQEVEETQSRYKNSSRLDVHSTSRVKDTFSEDHLLQNCPRVPSCERLPPDGHEFTSRTLESVISKPVPFVSNARRSVGIIKEVPPIPKKSSVLKNTQLSSFLSLKTPPPLPSVPPPLTRDKSLPDILCDPKSLANQANYKLKRDSIPLNEYNGNNNYLSKPRRRTIEGIILDSGSDKSSSDHDKNNLGIPSEILHTLSVKQKIALFSKENTSMSANSEKNTKPHIYRNELVKALPVTVVSNDMIPQQKIFGRSNSVTNEWEQNSNSSDPIYKSTLPHGGSPLSESSDQSSLFFPVKLSEPNLKLHNARLSSSTRIRSSSSEDLLNSDFDDVYQKKKSLSVTAPKFTTSQYNRWNDSDSESCISVSSSQLPFSSSNKYNQAPSILDSLHQRKVSSSKLKGLTIPKKTSTDTVHSVVAAPLIAPKKDVSTKTLSKQEQLYSSAYASAINSLIKPSALERKHKFQSLDNLNISPVDKTPPLSPTLSNNLKNNSSRESNLFYARPLYRSSEDEVFFNEKSNCINSEPSPPVRHISESLLTYKYFSQLPMELSTGTKHVVEPPPVKHISEPINPEPLPQDKYASKPLHSYKHNSEPSDEPLLEVKHTRSLSQPVSSHNDFSNSSSERRSRFNSQAQNPNTFSDKLKKFTELETLDQRRSAFSQKVATLCRPQDVEKSEIKSFSNSKDQVTDEVRAASKVPSAGSWNSSNRIETKSEIKLHPVTPELTTMRKDLSDTKPQPSAHYDKSNTKNFNDRYSVRSYSTNSNVNTIKSTYNNLEIQKQPPDVSGSNLRNSSINDSSKSNTSDSDSPLEYLSYKRTEIKQRASSLDRRQSPYNNLHDSYSFDKKTNRNYLKYSGEKSNSKFTTSESNSSLEHLHPQNLETQQKTSSLERKSVENSNSNEKRNNLHELDSHSSAEKIHRNNLDNSPPKSDCKNVSDRTLPVENLHNKNVEIQQKALTLDKGHRYISNYNSPLENLQVKNSEIQQRTLSLGRKQSPSYDSYEKKLDSPGLDSYSPVEKLRCSESENSQKTLSLDRKSLSKYCHSDPIEKNDENVNSEEKENNKTEVIKELKLLPQFNSNKENSSLNQNCTSDLSYKQHNKSKALFETTANRHNFIHSNNENNPKIECQVISKNISDVYTAKRIFHDSNPDSLPSSSLSSADLMELVEEANQYLGKCNLKDTEVFAVVITKDEQHREDIGISLVRGNKFEGTDIIVDQVFPGSLVETEGRIQKGDHIVLINGKSVASMRFRQVLDLLKLSYPEVNLILSRDKKNVVDLSEKNQPDLSSPTFLTTNFKREIVSIEMCNGTSTLGFSIDGGKNSPLGDRPLTVKKIFAGGVADHNGLLIVGDELLAVNSKDMTVLSRFDAWTYLRNLPPGPVTLKVFRLMT